MTLLMLFVYILVILLTVAFYTLLERKIIGYIHTRLGPNKLFFQGLLQPLMDAFKLLSKSYTIPFHANKYPYFSSPYFSLGISLFLWLVVVPLYYYFCSSPFSILFFACVTSLIVFPLLVRG
jgi:NADH-quinone oxidoreductase subunit H